MSKNSSFKTSKSLLAIAIASSCLAVGQAYAYPYQSSDNNSIISNIGSNTYTDTTKSDTKTFNNEEVKYNDKGEGPAVQAVKQNKFDITVNGTVNFTGGGVKDDGIISTKNDGQITLTGDTAVFNQVPLTDETKALDYRFGIRAIDNSSISFNNAETIVNAEFEKFAAGTNQFISVSTETNAKLTFDSTLTLNTTLKGDQAANLYGIRGNGNGQLIANNDVNVNINAENKSTATVIYGVASTGNSNLTFNKNLTVKLDAANAQNGGSKVAVSANDVGSKVTVGGDLDVNTNIQGTTAKGIHANNGGEIEVSGKTNVVSEASDAILAQGTGGKIGKVTLNGDVSINTAKASDEYWTKRALVANSGEININQNGGNNVNIHGGVVMANSGKLNMKLDTADSVFSGSIVSRDNASVSTFDFSNGAQWLVSKAEQGSETKVTNLTLNNSLVDVTADQDTYQNINIGNFSGADGTFVLNTDLASQTDSDKIKITNSDAGATAFIQVKDTSLANQTEVTGHKNLLVATDESGNVTFKGQTLNTGGLWDIDPTIENGLNTKDEDGNVIGTANEWYLTKIAKSLNNDSQILVKNARTNYGLWMNLTDTLRQRLGYVRGHASENGSVWSRYVGGEFNDANYNVVQLGYDRAYNANTLYGVAVETGLAEGRYQYGKEKDKLMSLVLYGVWTGDKGDYIDAVAKIGRISTKLNSYGDNPDRADFRNHAYALSVEHGKKIDFGKNQNLFIEPQVQVKFTKIGGTNYTTDRGTSVHTNDMNSLVGRVGMLAGFKVENGNQFYVKASALHEFLAKNNMSLAAANGEKAWLHQHYRDTWIELGVGTNIKLSDTSYFYGDVERSIKGDIDKKWQINAGLRFDF